MAGRNDRCSVCDHFRDDHASTGCLKPGCDCDGFTRKIVSYARSSKRGGRLHHAGGSSIAGVRNE